MGASLLALAKSILYYDIFYGMKDTAYNHAKTYCQIILLTRSGPCKWRDTLTPFQLLAKHCTFTGKKLWMDTRKPEIINIGETPYCLSDFGTLIKLFLSFFVSEEDQRSRGDLVFKLFCKAIINKTFTLASGVYYKNIKIY